MLAIGSAPAAAEHLEIAVATMPQNAVLRGSLAAAVATVAQDGRAAAIAAALQVERAAPAVPPTAQAAAAFGEALARCALGEHAAAIRALQAAWARRSMMLPALEVYYPLQALRMTRSSRP